MLQNIDKAQPDVGGSSRKLLVNLIAKKGQDPIVRSCEILQKQFRNRTSFSSESSLKEIFIDSIANDLQECIDRLSLEKTEVFSLPHYKLSVPGLSLGDAQIMATKKQDGSVNIILRFRFFFGGLSDAFKPEVQYDDFVQDQNGYTSAKVLSDIALPLLDLCMAAETGLAEASERLGAFGHTLAERAHEVKFQIELVQRYVEGIDRSKAFEHSFIEYRTTGSCT